MQSEFVRRLCGTVLLLLSIFLTVSLITYTTADYPDCMVFPRPVSGDNTAKILGSYAASWLLAVYGYGTYIIVFTLCAVGGWMMSGRRIDQFFIRTAGFILLVISVSVGATASLAPSQGPVIGAGGYVGAFVCGGLIPIFSLGGIIFLAVFGLFAGMILACDYTLLWVICRVLDIRHPNTGHGTKPAMGHGTKSETTSESISVTGQKTSRDILADKNRDTRPVAEPTAVVTPLPNIAATPLIVSATSPVTTGVTLLPPIPAPIPIPSPSPSPPSSSSSSTPPSSPSKFSSPLSSFRKPFSTSSPPTQPQSTVPNPTTSERLDEMSQVDSVFFTEESADSTTSADSATAQKDSTEPLPRQENVIPPPHFWKFPKTSDQPKDATLSPAPHANSIASIPMSTEDTGHSDGVPFQSSFPAAMQTPVDDENDDDDENLVQTETPPSVAETMAALLQDEQLYELPSTQLLTRSEPMETEPDDDAPLRQAQQLEEAFKSFGFNIRVVDIQTGPVIAQFELELERGLRLNKVMNLADDLAVALKVPSVRVVAPIPGKNTVGVEVPNEIRQMVRLGDLIEETADKTASMFVPIFLGKDVSGNPMVIDLAKMPHLLIAGRTGTGKSVCINSIIVSVLMTKTPEEVRMILIDPKMVEMSAYKTIPHLLHPVVTDMKKAEAILGWAVDKMEERYQLLARAGVRQLSDYNKLDTETLRRRIQPESDEEWARIPRKIPFLVIVADEMADLMMTSAKEVETHIIRLAQKSRAVGIHLVLATQKPTVNIITGLIKSNLPARIAFEVASRIDSQVVLDANGAEKLLGYGDMLFLKPGTSQLVRGQGTYVSDQEIEDVIYQLGTESQDFVTELIELKTGGDSDWDGDDNRDNRDSRGRGTAGGSGTGGSGGGSSGGVDRMYMEAVEFTIREGRGSGSSLQTEFSIGYQRANRLIARMCKDGILGQYNRSTQGRDVLMTLYDWRKRIGNDSAGTTAGAATHTVSHSPTTSYPPQPPKPIFTPIPPSTTDRNDIPDQKHEPYIIFPVDRDIRRDTENDNFSTEKFSVYTPDSDEDDDEIEEYEYWDEDEYDDV